MLRINPSYSGKLVYTTRDSNYPIEVRENRKIRWLHFCDGNIQSAMSRSHPERLTLDYMETMLGVLLFHDSPKTFCLLGLGGGGLVRYCHHYHPNINLTAIEISPTVVKIAKDYFSLPTESESFKIIIDDAACAIQTMPSQDIIAADLYGQNCLPTVFREKNFYANCYKALSDKGILAIKLLLNHQDNFMAILEDIRAVFKMQTLCVPIKYHKNMIVFAFKDKNYLSMLEELASCRKLKKLTLDSQYGLMATKIRGV